MWKSSRRNLRSSTASFLHIRCLKKSPTEKKRRKGKRTMSRRMIINGKGTEIFTIRLPKVNGAVTIMRCTCPFWPWLKRHLLRFFPGHRIFGHKDENLGKILDTHERLGRTNQKLTDLTTNQLTNNWQQAQPPDTNGNNTNNANNANNANNVRYLHEERHDFTTHVAPSTEVEGKFFGDGEFHACFLLA